jgi:hypothetical protein
VQSFVEQCVSAAREALARKAVCIDGQELSVK